MTQYKMPPPVPGSPRYELREDITETQTTIPLATIEGVPDAPNRLTFYYHGEVETIYYTGIDRETATLTGVTRGEGGTKAKAWLAGVQLARLFCAADYEAITHNIEDHEGRVDLLETSSDTHETRIGALEVGTADHAADRTNPHQVTPAQVRNTDPQWNADQIQSIQVDTTNLGHKKTLVYNGTLDKLEFVSHDDLDGTGTHSHTDLDAHVTDLKIHRPLDDAVISGTNLWSSQKTKNEIEAVNNVTKVNTHIASLEDHRKINDTSILATELWSAQKITNELATKSETGHTHPSAEISLSEKTTDDLNEGIVNHYHTEERVKKIIRDEKGTPSGLATLGVDGKIPSSQIPPVAITDTHVVQSEAEQLALDVQKGDICVRLDLDRSYINRDGINLGMSNWIELKSPENEVISVNGQTGAVSLTTTDIAEGTNLYYTEERVSANPTVVANTNTRHTHTNTILLDGITAPFTTELKTKLDGIEAGATADQSAGEVPFTPYETISSTNVQTAIQELHDDTQTKLAEKEPTIIKKTAFNKDFGTQAGTVCEGNDSRLTDDRIPTAHTHPGNEITSTVATATTCTGNAATATKLETTRTISLSGDVTGSATFDGTTNANIVATVADPVAPLPAGTFGDILFHDGTEWVAFNPGPLTSPKRTLVLLGSSLMFPDAGGATYYEEALTGGRIVRGAAFGVSQTTVTAQIGLPMPSNWDGGTVTAQFVFATTATTGTVTFGIAGRASVNGDALGQAFGTAQTVTFDIGTQTTPAAWDIWITGFTGDMAFAGTGEGRKWVQVEVSRDAGDTCAEDVVLLAVIIEYGTSGYSDA